MKYATLLVGILALSVSARNLNEAGLKEDVEQIGKEALKLGEKGLQFLGKAFEGASTHLEKGVDFASKAGKAVYSASEEAVDAGKSLYATAKEALEDNGYINKDTRNILNRANNNQ